MCMQAEDVLFSIGEALAFIWGGVSITADKILKSAYVSLSASSNFLTGDAPASGEDVEMSDAGNSSDDSQCDLAREKIIRKLFDELLFSSRKEERCAGSVWLLSIVSYCGRQTRVQQMLPQIQVRGPSLVSPIKRHGSTRENLIEKISHT